MSRPCAREGCDAPAEWPSRYCTLACSNESRLRIWSKSRDLPAPEGCNPVQAPRCQNEEDVDRTRRVLCRRYDDCLGHACNQNWPGFSCNECDGYDEAGEWELRRVAPVDASLNLIKAMGSQGRE